MSKRDFIKDVLFGVSVGDALGVPVEFKPRNILQQNQVAGMIGYGTHNQPPGTWSDDSSLTFCLAEMLCGKYNLQDLANRFINWKHHGYWTAHGDVFDIGIATNSAILNLATGMAPVLAGGNSEGSNGNGSLMRILPLLFHIRDKNIDERFQAIKDVSSLTHRHTRSILCCFIYLEFALEIVKGKNKYEAYKQACNTVGVFLHETATCTEVELNKLGRILSASIQELPQDEINSSGYVIHTLEAALWCILNTDNYKDAILKAVNLGDDTDTTGAVTGGLAGLLYGWNTIPPEWLTVLARKDDINRLSEKLNAKFNS
jgi:ADP-ribosyl-[dinitrogen reductase] hydrolase